MSGNYQRFLKVLELWPIDKSKVGRDFGEEIRKFSKKLVVSKAAAASSISPAENLKLTKEIEALERLAKNIYGRKYSRELNSTATGLTVEQCSQVLSSEFLQYLNKK